MIKIETIQVHPQDSWLSLCKWSNGCCKLVFQQNVRSTALGPVLLVLIQKPFWWESGKASRNQANRIGKIPWKSCCLEMRDWRLRKFCPQAVVVPMHLLFVYINALQCQCQRFLMSVFYLVAWVLQPVSWVFLPMSCSWNIMWCRFLARVLFSAGLWPQVISPTCKQAETPKDLC